MNKKAEIRIEDVTIPTYPVGEPSPHPMYLDKRVYQGNSGVVYPHPVIDKLYDEKEDRSYKAIYMENPYLRIMILPEIGGRVQMAYDKTNDYHFVYYNEVIKPALVGLAGPWISGGIEFNWPQHHRPTTFDPVDWSIEEREDGSVVAWVGELERMFRTKSVIAFTLYPDKAYIELNVTLFNRSESPQTFLWWANPAVAVHDQTQSIFPPDVHAVMDHGKRDTSRFPIATGTYYKMDYSAGVDISRYKNIPVPTSYMAFQSDYDFVGGYDYSKEGGILHVANHNISPGKKQWTWGCGDFGQAWDRNLTDENGPYIELMTGVYTDNQPDFSWLMPFEEKAFTQYFMPYKGLGAVSNANSRAALHLSRLPEGKIRLGVYVTEAFEDLCIELRGNSEDRPVLWSGRRAMEPEKAWEEEVELSASQGEALLELRILAQDREILSFRESPQRDRPQPEAAKPIPEARELKSTEELYLAGLHLEQYRHATFEAEDYYNEALRRDPEDIRVNNALGLLLFRKGLFTTAEEHFRRALKKMTRHNPNPYDGEISYNLGLALKFQGRFDEAYAAFYKSCWNQAWQAAGFFQVALIDCRRGNFQDAIEHLRKSLVYNHHNQRARGILIAVLSSQGKNLEAEREIDLALALDPLDHMARYEGSLLRGDFSEFLSISRASVNTFLEMSLEYYWGGFFDRAIRLLETEHLKDSGDQLCPLLPYYLAAYYQRAGKAKEAEGQLSKARQQEIGPCFPHFLESQLFLEEAIAAGEDHIGRSLLGHYYYARGRHTEAISSWESAVQGGSKDPTVFRNLSLAYFNTISDPEKALASMEKASALAPGDSRILFELDLLRKKCGIGPEERLGQLERLDAEVLEFRDDLYTEFIGLLNMVGRHEEALERIEGHIFHPWEGGEGKITKQFLEACKGLARQALGEEKAQQALDYLAKTRDYPKNLGEGKLHGAQENDIRYLQGLAYRKAGDEEKARLSFEEGSRGISEPSSAMFYNDQPPETIYYQGLCLEELKRHGEARSRFNTLIDYGERHYFDDVKIDYFAVSLPDFLVFDEDLNVKNRVHCRFMQGLGSLGLKRTQATRKFFDHVLSIDPNHQGVLGLEGPGAV